MLPYVLWNVLEPPLWHQTDEGAPRHGAFVVEYRGVISRVERFILAFRRGLDS
jgi:hypothetical protein